MTDDDEAARKRRADELHERIDSLKHRRGDAGAENDAVREQPDSGGGAESPRDFINEKMRELDR